MSKSEDVSHIFMTLFVVTGITTFLLGAVINIRGCTEHSATLEDARAAETGKLNAEGRQQNREHIERMTAAGWEQRIVGDTVIWVKPDDK